MLAQVKKVKYLNTMINFFPLIFLFLSFKISGTESCPQNNKQWVHYLPRHSKILDFYYDKSNNQGVYYRDLTTSNCQNYSYLEKKLERIISSSTTHIGFFKELESLNVLIGHTRIEVAKNGIEFLGNNVDREHMLKLRPDAFLTYHFNGEKDHASLFKLRTISIEEFKETMPLGRAEWLVFFGALLGKMPDAIKKFALIEKNYLQLKNQTSNYKNRPKVLVGNAQSGRWLTPEKNGIYDVIINDAGGELYLFSTKSIQLSWEDVFKKFSSVDIWLTHNYWRNIKEIVESEPRYKEMKAIKSGEVYNYHADGDTTSYWSMMGVRPDFLLEDVISMIHFKGKKKMHWYGKL